MGNIDINKKKPVKVLHIVGSMHPGGMENFIMNLYSHIDSDRVHFDFAVHMKRQGDYCEKIEAMGGTVYELPRLTSHPVRNLKQLAKIIRDGKYDIAVRHTANALVAFQLLAARHAGAKTICHSHNTTDPQKALHYFSRLFMKKATDIRFACSEDAGKWMFGRLDYRVIHNAVNIDSFVYDATAENDIRREFGCENSHLYGNIANFLDSKNHMYLLEIFRKLIDIDPQAKCVCYGDGVNRQIIENRIKELGLENSVILAGVRNDVAKFMSAMDVLIFPSKFEGLPLTLIESQAAGLPMLVSDRVTGDVVVTQGLVKYMSIDLEPEAWAEAAYGIAAGAYCDHSSRECQRDMIAEHGYDISELSRWYTEFCEKLC